MVRQFHDPKKKPIGTRFTKSISENNIEIQKFSLKACFKLSGYGAV